MDQQLESIKKLAQYVKASFVWCNLSFGELWYLTQTPETEQEKELCKGHTLNFYGIALQYVIVMEYAKMLEEKYSENEKQKNKNVGSIIRLNEEVKKFFGSDFQKALINDKILDELKTSKFYEKLRNLRDKKFGHIDADYSVNPLSIKGFSGNEIDECKRHLMLILQALNNCLEMFDHALIEKIPNRDNRTANFIRYHSKYQKYYHDNFVKAHNEGYGLS